MTYWPAGTTEGGAQRDAESLKWLKLSNSREHVTLDTQNRSKLSSRRPCRRVERRERERERERETDRQQRVKQAMKLTGSQEHVTLNAHNRPKLGSLRLSWSHYPRNLS
jgi:hypothetical protein